MTMLQPTIQNPIDHWRGGNDQRWLAEAVPPVNAMD